jgi:hypothetical protein
MEKHDVSRFFSSTLLIIEQLVRDLYGDFYGSRPLEDDLRVPQSTILL